MRCDYSSMPQLQRPFNQTTTQIGQALLHTIILHICTHPCPYPDPGLAPRRGQPFTKVAPLLLNILVGTVNSIPERSMVTSSIQYLQRKSESRNTPMRYIIGFGDNTDLLWWINVNNQFCQLTTRVSYQRGIRWPFKCIGNHTYWGLKNNWGMQSKNGLQNLWANTVFFILC